MDKLPKRQLTPGGRGGARAGSGRKCKGAGPRVRVSVALDPVMLQGVRVLAAGTGQSVSSVINDIISEHFIESLKE